MLDGNQFQVAEGSVFRKYGALRVRVQVGIESAE